MIFQIIELHMLLKSCNISFFVRVGGGGVEKWSLKLTSAKVEVEVEAEPCNS